jgi:hypothetical protein
MSTVNVPDVTLSPEIVIDPQILVVRPTAVEFCPIRTSVTRYPASEPEPTLYVPPMLALAELVLESAAVVFEWVVGNESFDGAGPSMRWM